MCTGRKQTSARQRARGGFTLVELLVALAVMVVAFAVVWNTFSAVLKAWRRGGQVVDEIRHGDFVIDQLVAALRSTAYFPLKPERYGFWLDDQGDEDSISWVTSGTAFMPPDSPLAQGVHRLMVSIESNDDGEDAFTVRAFPHLAEEIDKKDVPAWAISSKVKGLNVRVWNAQDEAWDDDWEDTNKIPGLIEVTLTMESPGKYDPPVKIARLVQIPLGPLTTGTTPVATGQPGAEGRGADDPNAASPGGRIRGEGGARGGAPANRGDSGRTRDPNQPRTRIISGK